MLSLLVITTALASPIDAWRVSAAMSREQVFDHSAAVVGYGDRDGGRLELEAQASPHLSGHLALARRASSSIDDGVGLGLELTDLAAGVAAGLAEPLFGWVSPYARADVLLGLAELNAQADLGDRRLIPGVEAALGARVSFGPVFLHAEGAASWRRPQVFALRPRGDGEHLKGPRTPLGELDLSSAAFRLGAGASF